jgi:hypothetical protein
MFDATAKFWHLWTIEQTSLSWNWRWLCLVVQSIALSPATGWNYKKNAAAVSANSTSDFRCLLCYCIRVNVEFNGGEMGTFSWGVSRNRNRILRLCGICFHGKFLILLNTRSRQNRIRCFEAANGLYRLRCRSLSVKLVPTFTGRGVPYGHHDGFPRPLIRSSFILTSLPGPRSRPNTSQKMWERRESNPGHLNLEAF